MISHYCFLNQFTFWDIFMWIHNNKQMLMVFLFFFHGKLYKYFPRGRDYKSNHFIFTRIHRPGSLTARLYCHTLINISANHQRILIFWQNLYWKENYLTSSWISTYHPFQTINSQCVLMAVITITILLWFSWRWKGNTKPKLWMLD